MPERLSPRQRDCLRLIWERQATSKEIAAELGISANTVNGYIAEAVEQLGARDRRDAARIVFADAPRTDLGGDPERVPAVQPLEASVAPSTEAPPPSRPWRTTERPVNTLTLAQTMGWIATIAIGSMVALAAAVSIGSSLPAVWLPALDAFRRLTH